MKSISISLAVWIFSANSLVLAKADGDRPVNIVAITWQNLYIIASCTVLFVCISIFSTYGIIRLCISRTRKVKKIVVEKVRHEEDSPKFKDIHIPQDRVEDVRMAYINLDEKLPPETVTAVLRQIEMDRKNRKQYPLFRIEEGSLYQLAIIPALGDYNEKEEVTFIKGKKFEKSFASLNRKDSSHSENG